MGPDNWITIYAAIVATGALFLEVRRWFESGPRIKVRVQPGMVIDTGKGEERYVCVTIRNRGTVATTITSLGIRQFPSRFHALINYKAQNFFVPATDIPGAAQSVPHLLNPGEQWIGVVMRNIKKVMDLEDGTVSMIVHTSDRDRAYSVRIPKNNGNEPKSINAS